jgi:hypothetical protein
MVVPRPKDCQRFLLDTLPVSLAKRHNPRQTAGLQWDFPLLLIRFIF